MAHPQQFARYFAGTEVHFSRGSGGCSGIQKYRQTPYLQAQVPIICIFLNGNTLDGFLMGGVVRPILNISTELNVYRDYCSFAFFVVLKYSKLMEVSVKV